MSLAGGRAATLAAITGAGLGIRDRFPTYESQRVRLDQLQAQLKFFVARRQPANADDVRAQIREIEQLMLSPESRLHG